MPDARVAMTPDRDAAPSDVTVVNGLGRADAHEALVGCCASQTREITRLRLRALLAS